MLEILVSIITNPVYWKIIVIIAIIVLAWLANRIINGLLSWWRCRITSRAQRAERAPVTPAETKIDMLQRIIRFTIYFLAAVTILFQIPEVLALGTTILATLGVLGIVAGLAAQATLSNLFAGLAIAFSQPVRLRDAVLYQGDWGWVEEITLMHTVIRTWDNRRLVVPNSVFNSTVIQNWTIGEEWLLAVVTLYVDYTCDIEQVRKWAKEIVAASPHSTSEKMAVTQVVDFTEKSMVLRVLGKSPDASTAWDLRCELREGLINRFHQAGLALPQVRFRELDSPTGGDIRSN
ncbi:MAG: mechanosensitive ion channel family protein [Chloroflexi bacterium]|nr:mechanosensitive ion channel family protein [Chloroflexota bacterium]